MAHLSEQMPNTPKQKVIIPNVKLFTDDNGLLDPTRPK